MPNKYINRSNQNYWIIGVLSATLMFLVPMVGSVAGLGWVLPTTFAGWVVYLVVKAAAVGLNMMIFHHFILQSSVNIADDPNYLEAEQLLREVMPELDPMSPEEFFGREYKHKGVTLGITTLLSTVCITQAILSFDYITLITHIVVVIFAIFFGIDEMRKCESWWVKDYLIYARWYVNKKQKEKENAEKTYQRNKEVPETAIHTADDTVCANRGTSILESTNNNSNICGIPA